MIAFTFDRDMTIDTGDPPGPVPVAWLRALSRDHIVCAHGNQALKREADIIGVTELRRLIESELGGDARVRHVGYVDRVDRVRMVKEAFPDCDRYICVDDVDLSELESEGWEYYTPDEFVDSVFDQVMSSGLEDQPALNLTCPSLVSTRLGVFYVDPNGTRRLVTDARTLQWLRSEGLELFHLGSEDEQLFYEAWPEGENFPRRAAGGGWE